MAPTLRWTTCAPRLRHLRWQGRTSLVRTPALTSRSTVPAYSCLRPWSRSSVMYCRLAIGVRISPRASQRSPRRNRRRLRSRDPQLTSRSPEARWDTTVWLPNVRQGACCCGSKRATPSTLPLGRSRLA